MLTLFGSCCNGGRINEKGMFYGVNLRQTKVLMVCGRLQGKNQPISDLYVDEVPIPSSVMIGTSQVHFFYLTLIQLGYNPLRGLLIYEKYIY